MFGITDQDNQRPGMATSQPTPSGDPINVSSTTSPLLSGALSHAPLEDSSTEIHPITGVPMPKPPTTPEAHSLDDVSTSLPGSEGLLAIKQDALKQLTPLVGKLEQSAEEKFKTTMMMIQATDDQSLVKTAYEQANAIEDEKAKAQALLDVVNEINYFTQAKKD